MSYRDDHQAALARIDALEDELARLRATQVIEVEPTPPRRELSPWILGALLVPALVVGATIYIHDHVHTATPVATAAAAGPAPAPGHLMACVAQLDGAIDTAGSIGSDCIEQIRDQATDTGLGPDVHDVLARWLTSEEALANAAAPFDRGGALAQRDRLASAIHEVVRPELTR